MLQEINAILTWLDDVVWGVPLMVLILAGGIYLTVRMGVLSLVKELSYMLDMMKVPRTLSAAGVNESDYKAVKADILRAAVADPCTATNPRHVGEADVELIVNKLIDWNL